MAFVFFPGPTAGDTPVIELTPTAQPGLTYPIKKSPLWAGVERRVISGGVVRGSRQAFPLWEYELEFAFLRDETANQTPYAQYLGLREWEQFVALFGACRGAYGQFYIFDPDDGSRTGAILATAGTVAAPNQSFLPITDGVSTVYVPLRQWGGVDANGFDLSTYEPVGGIKSVQNINFDHGPTISYTVGGADGRSIVFATPPAAGFSLTIDLNFYYRVRFQNDPQEVEEFMENLHKGIIKLRTVKP